MKFLKSSLAALGILLLSTATVWAQTETQPQPDVQTFTSNANSSGSTLNLAGILATGNYNQVEQEILGIYLAAIGGFANTSLAGGLGGSSSTSPFFQGLQQGDKNQVIQGLLGMFAPSTNNSSSE
jgi:hypothetical protein